MPKEDTQDCFTCERCLALPSTRARPKDCADCVLFNIVKTCLCGQRYTNEGWKALRLVGKQRIRAADGQEEEYLELRNCGGCQSTITLDMTASLLPL